MKKLRKGFTIVELVIVIAVIAVLAAVLIPTFVHLSKKAKVASDQSLVANLNTALKMEEGETGKKPETMHDAVKGLLHQGYYVPQLVTRSDEELVYNIADNKFSLSSSVQSGRESEYWHIQKNATNPKGWSIYAFKWTSSEAGNATEPLHSGFDAGDEYSIDSIYFGGGSDAIIRTNGGSLTINAKDNDVRHIGYAESVNIIDVKSSSYHEEGEVKFLEVAAGHVVLEAGADVTAVHFTATNGQFKNEENKTISIDVSNIAPEAMPSFSRDEVDIPENGAYVAQVTSDETEYIWLFGEGIKEQMVVTTSSGAIAEEGTLKPEVSVGAEEGSIAEQVANPAKRNENGELLDSNDQVIDISAVDFTQSDALDTLGVQTEQLPDKENIQTGVTLFDGGSGSELDPYLISNREELQNTGKIYSESSYFKVEDQVRTMDCSNWETIEYFGGTLDGNGVVLNNLDKPLIEFVYDGKNDSTATFKNIDAVCNMHYSIDRGALITYSTVKHIVFDNVNVSGIIESPLGCSAYVGYGNYGYNYYYFNNCVSDVSLVATGGAASGFVNHPGYSTKEGSSPSTNAKIFISDSIFTGRMSANKSGTNNTFTSNFNFKYFVVNSNGLAVTTKYSESFISEYGDPVGTLYGTPSNVTENEDGSITFNAGNYGSSLVDYYRPTNAGNRKQVLLSFDVATPAKGINFTFSKLAGAGSVTVTLEIGANDESGYGNYVATYEVETIDVSKLSNGASVSTQEIKNFNILVVPKDSATRETGAFGSTYYVVSSRNGSTYGSAVVRFVQYDDYGNVLGTKAVSIA